MIYASTDLLIIMVAFAAAVTFIAIVARPNAALACSFLLVHFATTKFRNRSAQALLAGQVDAQIWFELAVYAVVAIIVCRSFLRIPAGQRGFRPYELLILAYLMIASVSVLWSPNPAVSAVRAVQCWILLALAYTAVRTLTPARTWDAFVWSIAAFVLLGSAIALLFPSTTNDPVRDIRRFSFFALHPLAVAAYSGTAALFMGARVLFPPPGAARRFLGLPVWAYIPPIIAIHLATRSRGALTGFAVAALVLLMRKFVVGPAAHRTYMTLAAVFAWLAGTFFVGTQQLMRLWESDSTIAQYVLRGGTVEQFLTLNGRNQIFRAVGELFVEKPDFGYGFMASRSILLDKIPWAGHTHNGLAESLLNVGLIGTLVLWSPFILTLLMAWIATFRTPADRITYPAAILAGCLFLLFNAVVSPSFAGGPGFEFLLLVVLVHVHAHANVKDRLPRRVEAAGPGRPPYSYAPEPLFRGSSRHVSLP